MRRLGFDERFTRMWDFYLGWCEGAFRERYVGAAQMVIAKNACDGYRRTRCAARITASAQYRDTVSGCSPLRTKLTSASYGAGVIVDDPPAFGEALPDQREDAADVALLVAGQVPVAENQAASGCR